MATVPTAPIEAAGTISTSADWNAWAGAASFLLNSSAGSRPMFFLMNSASQTFNTTAVAVNWSSTASIFKDNDGGWSSGLPSKYTVQTQGYWTVDYSINGGPSATYMQTYVVVTTTAANLLNPSTTLKFCYNASSQTTSFNGGTASSSLCPILLYPNDTLQVFCYTSASSASGSPNSSFSGQWVSA